MILIMSASTLLIPGTTAGKFAAAVYVLRGARYAEQVDHQVSAIG